MDSMETNLIFPNPSQFRETCFVQDFSLPVPILKHIWTNPSTPKVYQNLIQCCKIFFIKNPILVIDDLYYNCHGWSYCKANECPYAEEDHKHREIKMNKIKGKIWLLNKLSIVSNINYTKNSGPFFRRDEEKLQKMQEIQKRETAKYR